MRELFRLWLRKCVFNCVDKKAGLLRKGNRNMMRRSKNQAAMRPWIAFRRVRFHGSAVVINLPRRMRDELGLGAGSSVRLELVPGEEEIRVKRAD